MFKNMSHNKKEILTSKQTADIMADVFYNTFKIENSKINIKKDAFIFKNYEARKERKASDMYYLIENSNMLSEDVEEGLIENDFNIYGFDGDNIFFVKSIYNKENKTLNYFPDIIYVKEYVEKVIVILSNFFQEVNVAYVVEGEFSRNIGYDISNQFLPLNDLFKPTFKINSHFIRVLGKTKSDDLDPDEIKYIDFTVNGNKSYIDAFFNDCNEKLLPKNCEIQLYKDDSLENLKAKLSLIEIILI